MHDIVHNTKTDENPSIRKSNPTVLAFNYSGDICRGHARAVDDAAGASCTKCAVTMLCNSILRTHLKFST